MFEIICVVIAGTILLIIFTHRPKRSVEIEHQQMIWDSEHCDNPYDGQVFTASYNHKEEEEMFNGYDVD